MASKRKVQNFLGFSFQWGKSETWFDLKPTVEEAEECRRMYQGMGYKVGSVHELSAVPVRRGGKR